MQEKSGRGHENPEETQSYIHSNQLAPEDFDTTFENKLNPENRWVKLALTIPWDKIVSRYDHLLSNRKRALISGRVILGTMLIKRLEMLTEHSTIQHINENPYMQYFLGYSRFTCEVPFTAHLFADIHHQMPKKLTNDIDKIVATDCMEWDYGAYPENNDVLPF